MAVTKSNYMHANVINEKGVLLENCRGFVDGTVRPICRPQKNQWIVDNGHKILDEIKFQYAVAPN